MIADSKFGVKIHPPEEYDTCSRNIFTFYRQDTVFNFDKEVRIILDMKYETYPGNGEYKEQKVICTIPPQVHEIKKEVHTLGYPLELQTHYSYGIQFPYQKTAPTSPFSIDDRLYNLILTKEDDKWTVLNYEISQKDGKPAPCAVIFQRLVHLISSKEDRKTCISLGLKQGQTTSSGTVNLPDNNYNELTSRNTDYYIQFP